MVIKYPECCSTESTRPWGLLTSKSPHYFPAVHCSTSAVLWCLACSRRQPGQQLLQSPRKETLLGRRLLLNDEWPDVVACLLVVLDVRSVTVRVLAGPPAAAEHSLYAVHASCVGVVECDLMYTCVCVGTGNNQHAITRQDLTLLNDIACCGWKYCCFTTD